MRLITGKIDPRGIFIDATIMATPPHVAAIRSRNRPIPQPAIARTLVDTGAASCVLDSTLIHGLGLIPTGKTLVHTATTGAQYEEREQYDASFFLVEPGTGATAEYLVSVIGSDLASEGFLAIIGWDILFKCLLTCDGPARTFRLGF
jgi:hypothetical protein